MTVVDASTQREVADRAVEALDRRDVPVVLIGSTAIVAQDLYPKTSKDVDLLPPADLDLSKTRAILDDVGHDLDADVSETGWGTVSLVETTTDEDAEPWKVDLVVPGPGAADGVIPPDAANRIRSRAEDTDIAPAAIPEHILAMKAVAYGDCIGKGQRGEALTYRGDVMELRERLDDVDRDEVQALLERFPEARAGPARGVIEEVFGVELGGSGRRRVSS